MGGGWSVGLPDDLFAERAESVETRTPREREGRDHDPVNADLTQQFDPGVRITHVRTEHCVDPDGVRIATCFLGPSTHAIDETSELFGITFTREVAIGEAYCTSDCGL